MADYVDLFQKFLNELKNLIGKFEGHILFPEKQKRYIYIIGSLKNPQVPIIANRLRKENPNWEVFDSWFYCGPEADDFLRDHCKNKGLNYKQTLKDPGAVHVFQFDREHLTRATDVVMVMGAGRSAHLELGVSLGEKKRGYVLFDKEPERVDVMYQFATDIFFSYEELAEELKKYD